MNKYMHNREILRDIVETLEQQNKLGKHEFSSTNGKLFDLHIDVKYTNQLSLGPTIINYENKIK